MTVTFLAFVIGAVLGLSSSVIAFASYIRERKKRESLERMLEIGSVIFETTEEVTIPKGHRVAVQVRKSNADN